MGKRHIGRRAASLFAVFSVAASIAPAGAEERRRSTEENKENKEKKEKKETKEKKHDLEAYGKLRPVRGADGFFEFAYTKKDEKGKPRRATAYIRIPDSVTLLRDARIPIDELGPGEKVAIFGKPRSFVVGGQGAVFEGKEYQIQNAHVVVAGGSDSFPIDTGYRNRRLKGLKWCEGKVLKSRGGLHITYGGQEHLVGLKKGSPVLRREEADRKLLKRALIVRIIGDRSGDFPERKSKKVEESFRARMVAVLDPRSVRSVYPLIWGDGERRSERQRRSR